MALVPQMPDGDAQNAQSQTRIIRHALETEKEELSRNSAAQSVCLKSESRTFRAYLSLDSLISMHSGNSSKVDDC